MMRALTILKKARKLLNNPKRWCQGAFAKGEGGGVIFNHADRAKAKSFCALGALEKVAGTYDGTADDETRDEVVMASRLLVDVVHGRSMMCYNDDPRRKHAQILAAFDRAIKRASK